MHAEELLDAGELAIAFEFLCTQVYEWSVPVTSGQVDALERVGRLLATDPKYVDHLRTLIAETPSDQGAGEELGRS